MAEVAKVDSGGDWPVQATDTIVSVVGQVRDKTTGPIITVARGVVYGTLAAIVGVAAAVLACILAVRLLSIPVEEWLGGTDRIWVVYLVLGTLAAVAGLLCWRKAWAAPVND